MIVALALLLGVVLVASSAPAVLDRMIKHRVEPQVVLVTWLVLVTATFLTVLATLLVVLLPTHGPKPILVQLVHHCWTALRHGAVPQLHELTALVLLVPVSIVATLLGRGLLRFTRQQRRMHERHLELLLITAEAEAGRFSTMWLPHPKPLAYSVAGIPPFVVATQGVRDELGAAEADAVIEHERAHLRGRHHMLVGLAEALAESVPWVPLTRHSPRLVRMAVELAADRAAARTHSPAAVRSALRIMADESGHTTSQLVLGMAESCTQLRLQHLDKLRASSSIVKRLIMAGFATSIAASSPLLAGMGVLMAIGTVSCPFPFAG
ncbi:M56 family metallopeptidase [Saccharopolyspora sp. ID03-671]|uniref:M56 family metallopeptidase n=1 Tax=Saccharopolyspora sp. ID03-671 TaxID=3073066 RepID=UPI003256861E